MATKKTVKVRETSTHSKGGFGQLGSTVKVERIIEVSEDQVPQGAEIVSNDTPVSDWMEIE